MDLDQRIKDVASIHKDVSLDYQKLLKNQYLYYSPMIVSQLLLNLKKVRRSLEILQDLPSKQQEELAYLSLNSCKLIYDIAQPLLWFNCGKYVVESLGFAAVSMEAVINLCTLRHLKFRMKLYASIFYACLSQGNIEETLAILDHAMSEWKMLKEREELDPPIPEANLINMKKAEEDLLVLKYVLDFWKDSDNLDLSSKNIDKYKAMLSPSLAQVVIPETTQHYSYDIRFLHEIIRIHLLSSGNPNEAYKKRSHSIFNLTYKYLSQNISETPNLFDKFDVQSVFEFLYFLFLEGSREQTLEISRGIHKWLEEQQLQGELRDKLEVMIKILQIQDSELSKENIDILFDIKSRLNSLIYIDTSYRNKTFYSKLSIELFSRCLFKPIQQFLSKQDHKHFEVLKRISSSLVTIIKLLDLTFYQDPIFQASISLMTSNLLFHIQEHREAISLLKSALRNIEEHRAYRVDFYSLFPEDARDIRALQRSSFTTRSNQIDWYHSIKRLGANAFAGFGIFGLSSSSDRFDQALAEIQTDLLALYFRIELQYAVKRFYEHKQTLLSMKEQQAIKEFNNKNPNKKDDKKTLKTIKATIFGNSNMKKSSKDYDEGLIIEIENDEFDEIEKLPIVTILKVYCAKNPYSLSLLFIEMSSIEANLEFKNKYLQQAISYLESAESQEEKLSSSFQDFTLMRDSIRTYPLILSRSHRYIYVAPVACRKTKKVNYYKILGKEKGSGTDVSIYNTDLPGSEKKIKIEEIHHFNSATVVKIGPLRNGELYMFGSCGYDAQDNVVGGVSPSSPVVEALNPLPTIMLWAMISKISAFNNLHHMSLSVCDTILNKFIIPSPKPAEQSLINGINLFQVEEIVVMSLAVHQATPHILFYFLETLLLKEEILFQPDLYPTEIRFNQRKGLQLQYLSSITKLVTILPYIQQLQNQFLLSRTLSLLFKIFQEIVRIDFVSLSKYLERPLMTIILAMQSLSKANWYYFEHTVYYSFFGMFALVTVLNRNIKPLIYLISNFYSEIADKANSVSYILPTNKSLLEKSMALAFLIQDKLTPKLYEQFTNELKELIRSYNEVDSKSSSEKKESEEEKLIDPFWKALSLDRSIQLLNQSIALVGGVTTTPVVAAPAKGAPTSTIDNKVSQLEKVLTQTLPLCYSDYLSCILQILKELISKQKWDLIPNFTAKFPIIQDYLAVTIQSQTSDFGVVLIRTLKDIVEANKAVAPPVEPPKKGAPAKPVSPRATEASSDPLIVPERFKQTSDVEIELQNKYLAQIIGLTTTFSLNSYRLLQFINYFPKSNISPYFFLDGHSQDQYNTFHKLVEDVETEIPSENQGSSELLIQLFKSYSLAIELSISSNQPLSAVVYVARLWQLIINQYFDIVSFIRVFRSEKGLLFKVYHLIYKLLSLLAYNKTEVLDLTLLGINSTDIGEASASSQFGGSNITSDNNPNLIDAISFLTKIPEDITKHDIREVKEKYSLVLEFVAYLTKVLFVLQIQGVQVIDLYMKFLLKYFFHASEYCIYLLDQCSSLIQHFQMNLIHETEDQIASRKQELDQFIDQFHIQQSKKKKKKLRIDNGEKSEEELVFEYDCKKRGEVIESFETTLANYQTTLNYSKSIISVIKQFLYPKEIQSLYKARLYLIKTQMMIYQNYGYQVNFKELLTNSSIITPLWELHESRTESGLITFPQIPLSENFSLKNELQVIIANYKKAITLLRNKKNITLLLEAILDVANLMIKCQLFDKVKQYLYDIIDGYFNTMDVALTWKANKQSYIQHLLSSQANDSHSPYNIQQLLYVFVALSKLIKYCAVNNYDEKIQYLDIMNDLSIYLFYYDSVEHPVDLAGYRAYECLSFNGLNLFGYSHYHTLIYDLIHAIEEALQVTIHANSNRFLGMFPLVVLGEYLARFYLKNVKVWMQMRIYRLQMLLMERYFTEYFVMLYSIPYTIFKINSTNHTEPPTSWSKILGSNDFFRWNTNNELQNDQTKVFELSNTGLKALGIPALFKNNLFSFKMTGNDDILTNDQAIEWVATYPQELETFLFKYKLSIPDHALTVKEQEILVAIKLQRSQLEQQQKEAQAAAEAEAAKKKGGKAPPPKTETGPSEAESALLNQIQREVPLFSYYEVIDVYLSVADFLISISTLSYTNSSNYILAGYKENINKIILLASNLISKSKEYLLSKFHPNTKKKDILEYIKRSFYHPIESGSITSSLSDLSVNGNEPSSYFLDLISQDSNWLRLYYLQYQLEVKILLFSKRYREIFFGSVQWMKILQNIPSSKTNVNSAFRTSSFSSYHKQMMSFVWYSLRDIQIRISMIQSRLSDSLLLTQQTKLELQYQTNNSLWIRKVYLQQAYILYQQGNVKMAYSLVQQLLSYYPLMTNTYKVLLTSSIIASGTKLKGPIEPPQTPLNISGQVAEDNVLIYLLIMKTKLIRLQLSTNTNTIQLSNGHYLIFNLLLLANKLAQSFAQQAGAFSADSNVTFVKVKDPNIKTHLLAPTLHHFTTLYDNEAELNNLSLFRQFSDDLSLKKLRSGPVDPSDINLAPSEFTNVYLSENRLYLLCQVHLLLVLDDMRSSGIFQFPVQVTLPLKDNDNVEELLKNNNSLNSSVSVYYDLNFFTEENLFEEQRHVAENCLKLLRHCIFVPPSLRALVYLYASKTRLSVHTPIIPGKEVEMRLNQFDPLSIALKYLVSVQATYCWDIMRIICIQMIDVYGDRNRDFGDEFNENRVKSALQYFTLAIQLQTQQKKLTRGVVDLIKDPSFTSVPLNPDLQSLIHNMFTTSISGPLPQDEDPIVIETPAVVDPKAAKGKAPAPAASKGAPPSTTTTNVTSEKIYTGRDALNLLSVLFREKDNLWLDEIPFSNTMSSQLAYEVHVLLKKNYPVYDSQCSLSVLPTTKDNLNIPINSISAIWKVVRTPLHWNLAALMNPDGDDTAALLGKKVKREVDPDYGLFSHVSLYVLLGDQAKAPVAPPVPEKGKPPAKGAEAPMAPTTSVNPLFTKIVLYRDNVKYLLFTCRSLIKELVSIEEDVKLVAKITNSSVPPLTSTFSLTGEFGPFVKSFANTMYCFLLMLREGFFPISFKNPQLFLTQEKESLNLLSWGEENLKISDEGNLKVNIEAKIVFSVPITIKFLTVMVNFFNSEDDLNQAIDSDLNQFIRYALSLPSNATSDSERIDYK